MTLLHLIVVLVVVGVLLWLITSYVPLEPTIRKLLVAVVVIVLVLWLLSAFGLLPAIASVRVPRA